MKSETLVFRAIDLAVKAHAGQYRKGTKIPYIIHPLNVAKIMIESECEETLVVAGLLHDTVEDTDVTLDDIQQAFGEEIARLVAAVSESDKSDTWENRKRQTIEHLKTAPMEVLLIECADKLDNIRAIREDHARVGESVWSRFARPKESQLWYYESLAAILDSRMGNGPYAHLSDQFRTGVRKVFGSVKK